MKVTANTPAAAPERTGLRIETHTAMDEWNSFVCR